MKTVSMIFLFISSVLNAQDMISIQKSLTKLKRISKKPTFKTIPRGRFIMGAVRNVPEADKNLELPRFRVSISKSFEIQSSPITQSQWFQVMKNNPSFHREKKYCPESFLKIHNIPLCPNHPVENVLWEEANYFVTVLNNPNRKLLGDSELIKLFSDNFVYRLPSEAEWEYSLRAQNASRTKYWFGNDSNDLKHYNWYKENSGNQTHEVGIKAETAPKKQKFGLTDMHGNVYHWMRGYFLFKYPIHGEFQHLPDGTKEDPMDPIRYSPNGSPKFRPIRGCAFLSPARDCRSAYRQFSDRNLFLEIDGVVDGEKFLPQGKDKFIGFRLTRKKKN